MRTLEVGSPARIPLSDFFRFPFRGSPSVPWQKVCGLKSGGSSSGMSAPFFKKDDSVRVGALGIVSNTPAIGRLGKFLVID